MRDIGRFGEHVGDLGLQGSHRLEGNVLARQRRHLQLADILEREEAFGNRVELVDRQRHRAEKHRKHHDMEAEAQLERATIAAKHGIEAALQRAADAAAFAFVILAHGRHARRQHRRQRKRHEGRRQDRHRHHHGELVENLADDATHQQHRDEHGDQRYRDRDDGEADLARTLERCVERAFTVLLGVPDDVLQHDDRIVDDEADRQRQRHQRDVVDRKAEQVHHGERRDQRDRDGKRRDQRRPDPPHEGEDHQDHQRDRQRQRELDVADRGADRARAVVEGLQRRGGRQLVLERRQHRLDRIDHRHRVGVRLPLDREDDGAGAVIPARGLVVGDGIDDARDVAKPHRFAVGTLDDELGEGGGIVELRVGDDRQLLLVALQACRAACSGWPPRRPPGSRRPICRGRRAPPRRAGS